MSADDQLLYETRVRTRSVIVAVAAAVFLLIGSIISLTGAHTNVSELTLDLLVANKRFPTDLIASILNGIASLAIAGTLVFLFDCARARRPETKPWARWLTIVAGLLAAISGVVYEIVIAIKVHQFATTGAQTYDEAHSLTAGGGVLGLQLIGEFSALLLAVAFVMVSLQAMNVGLLSKFMGYLGMFAGALVLFQITQVPIVQAYWLAAIAVLLAGRWPNGTPPAWRSGRAEPWPSSAELRAKRAAAGGARRTRGAPQPAAAAPTPAEVPVNSRTRASTPKRKRKRRN
jgi:hypothetical protein